MELLWLFIGVPIIIAFRLARCACLAGALLLAMIFEATS